MPTDSCHHHVHAGRAASLVVGVALLSICIGAERAHATVCPNEQLRSENHSATLPDCRAYELVSTAQTGENEVIGGLVTADGAHVQYGIGVGVAGPISSHSGEWVAARSSTGWASTNFALPGDEKQGTGGVINGSSPTAFALSADGSRGVYVTVHALSPGDRNEALDVYSGRPGGAFTWLTESAMRGGLYGGEADVEYEGSTPDLSTVVFEAHQQLLPGAPAALSEGEESGRQVYAWHAGRLALVSVLPGEADGAPGGAAVGSGPLNSANLNAVSSDGSRVFFESPDPTYNPPTPPQLYLRLGPDRTVEVSAPAPGTTDPEGPQAATYLAATPDGSKVFFRSRGALTADARTVGDTTEDLYQYEVASEKLTDLSSAGLADPSGSQVLGVAGISQDGGMVYFVAKGQLTAQASEGADNLYLYHDGVVTYVAGLAEADEGDWGLFNPSKPVDVAPDGEHLAFVSTNSPAGYESKGAPEMYEFDARAVALTCVSCKLGVVPALGVDPGTGVAAFNGTPRFMTNDGSRVFFDSAESLVPAAADGQANAYEYEHGNRYLISTGTSSAESRFKSVSPGGADVYFTTSQPLVAAAGGENAQLYDARAGGGFPAPAPAPLGCSGAECQPASAPTPPPLPGSAVFTGGANATPSPPPPPSVKPPRSKLRRQLARALALCRRHTGRRRARCERGARARYGSRRRSR
jgi:hypothetical protein